jgi:hypothetical protein
MGVIERVIVFVYKVGQFIHSSSDSYILIPSIYTNGAFWTWLIIDVSRICRSAHR